MNADFAVVDQFSEYTGGVVTVFARKGDDFVRITTSLRNVQGERVMNTQLDRHHPAYALMLSGQPYVARANLFGKPYDRLPPHARYRRPSGGDFVCWL